jgi:hypothetical protein
MKRIALIALMVAALTLTGCTRGSSGSAPAPDSTGSAVKPPVSGETPPSGAEPPAQAGGAGLPEQKTFASSMEIAAPGTYIIDVASGKVQGWETKGTGTGIRFSDDRRWVIMDTQTDVTWLNRATGATFGWNRPDRVFLGAGGGHVLLAQSKEGNPTGTYEVIDQSGKVQTSFRLAAEQGPVSFARFAPDGSHVAVFTTISEGTLVSRNRAFVIDLASGTAHELERDAREGDGRAVFVGPVQGSASPDLLIAYTAQIPEPSGQMHFATTVRRFDWQGKKLGEFSLMGTEPRLSPDGKLLLSAQDLDHMASAAVVTEMATGKPLFRVAGLSNGQWLADSSGLLLTGYDMNRMVTRTGDLKPAPAIPPSETPAFMSGLQPSPDDAALFVGGMSVFDGAGKVVREVKLPKRDDWLVHGLSWGATSREVILTITEPMGKGNLGWDFPLPVEVQKAPFDDPWILQVKDPKGECANLRESYSTTARVIRCLPTGTKLAAGDLSQALTKLNYAFIGQNSNEFWAWVRTEQGETGWVSLSSGAIQWAD